MSIARSKISTRANNSYEVRFYWRWQFSSCFVNAMSCLRFSLCSGVFLMLRDLLLFWSSLFTTGLSKTTILGLLVREARTPDVDLAGLWSDLVSWSCKGEINCQWNMRRQGSAEMAVIQSTKTCKPGLEQKLPPTYTIYKIKFQKEQV